MLLCISLSLKSKFGNYYKVLLPSYFSTTLYYDNIRAFKSKLVLWEMQFSKNSPVHFPFLKELYNTGTVTELSRYKESISSLLQEFERRFQVFSELELEFKIF